MTKFSFIPDMMTYKIYVTFTAGAGRLVEEHTDDTLISALQRLTLGPAAVSGIIDEVRVIDSDGYCVFLADKDNSERALHVSYPPSLVLSGTDTETV